MFGHAHRVVLGRATPDRLPENGVSQHAAFRTVDQCRDFKSTVRYRAGVYLKAYFGRRARAACDGRAMTWQAISFPRPSTLGFAASMAAETAATSPRMTTVT